MRYAPTTLRSNLARLAPVLLLIVAVSTAPAWGGTKKRDAQDVKATPCCKSHDEGDPNRQSSEDEDADGGCCGRNCHGCLCPCAKLVLISGLDLAPTVTSIEIVPPFVVLSAISLSEADPIFHPPRV
jgi:hypothetical protein